MAVTSDTFDELAIAVANAGFRRSPRPPRIRRSDQPRDGYDYDTLSDDLAAVVAMREQGRVTLVGFSMGGGEVARYMSRHEARRDACHSDRFGRPAHVKTADNRRALTSACSMGDSGAAGDLARFWGAFFKDFYGAGRLSPVSDEVIAWSQARDEGQPKATLDCATRCDDGFRKDGKAKVPTLVIHGTDDKIVPSTHRAAPPPPASKAAS
jgi:pimeloyl-ACP methyl ester carboxylesterase